jgi:alpha-D-ribose 1-methylphosphonate 5-triphosphate synthase subunit PhnH
MKMEAVATKAVDFKRLTQGVNGKFYTFVNNHFAQNRNAKYSVAQIASLAQGQNKYPENETEFIYILTALTQLNIITQVEPGVFQATDQRCR